MERTIYSDIDVNLNMHPITHDVIKKVNENSIRQSLRLLLQTVFYDRKWQPAVGCYLNQHLFGLLDDYQLNSTEEQLRKVIEKYEPRVRIDELSCQVSDSNSYKVDIRMTYTILILDKTDTFVYTINKVR